MTCPAHGFSVGLPVAPLSISVARSIVRRITTFADDDAESSFLVALTEVVANALDEHERTVVDQDIVLTIATEPHHVVSVIDRGAGMEPHPPSSEDVGVLPDSGRGLALARAFVPGLEIDSSSSGTTVSLPLVGLGLIR